MEIEQVGQQRLAGARTEGGPADGGQLHQAIASGTQGVRGSVETRNQKRKLGIDSTNGISTRSRRKESLTVDVSIASIAADQLVPSSSSGQTQQQGLYEETWNKGFLQHGQTFVKHTSTSADGPQLVSTPSCEAPLSLLASSAFESLHGVLAAAKKWDGATSFQEAAEGFPAHPQTSQSQHCQPPAVPTAHAAAQAQEGRSQPARLPCQQHCQGDAAALGAGMTEDQLRQAYVASVQALKEYMVSCDLLTYDITGSNLPEDVAQSVRSMLHHVCKVCLQALKPEVPCVLQVVAKDQSAAPNETELDRQHWAKVAAVLQLSPQQVSSILQARKSHGHRMEALYHERALLTQRMAEVAAASQAPVQSSPQVSAHKQTSTGSVLMQHGYLYCAKRTLQLHSLMGQLKDTMSREQRLVMELLLRFVYQILSPVQAALFMVQSFPYHFDCMALANVVAETTATTAAAATQQGSTPSCTSGPGAMFAPSPATHATAPAPHMADDDLAVLQAVQAVPGLQAAGTLPGLRHPAHSPAVPAESPRVGAGATHSMQQASEKHATFSALCPASAPAQHPHHEPARTSSGVGTVDGGTTIVSASNTGAGGYSAGHVSHQPGPVQMLPQPLHYSHHPQQPNSQLIRSSSMAQACSDVATPRYPATAPALTASGAVTGGHPATGHTLSPSSDQYAGVMGRQSSSGLHSSTFTLPRLGSSTLGAQDASGCSAAQLSDGTATALGCGLATTKGVGHDVGQGTLCFQMPTMGQLRSASSMAVADSGCQAQARWPGILYAAAAPGAAQVGINGPSPAQRQEAAVRGATFSRGVSGSGMQEQAGNALSPSAHVHCTSPVSSQPLSRRSSGVSRQELGAEQQPGYCALTAGSTIVSGHHDVGPAGAGGAGVQAGSVHRVQGPLGLPPAFPSKASRAHLLAPGSYSLGKPAVAFRDAPHAYTPRIKDEPSDQTFTQGSTLQVRTSSMDVGAFLQQRTSVAGPLMATAPLHSADKECPAHAPGFTPSGQLGAMPSHYAAPASHHQQVMASVVGHMESQVHWAAGKGHHSTEEVQVGHRQSSDAGIFSARTSGRSQGGSLPGGGIASLRVRTSSAGGAPVPAQYHSGGDLGDLSQLLSTGGRDSPDPLLLLLPSLHIPSGLPQQPVPQDSNGLAEENTAGTDSASDRGMFEAGIFADDC